MEASVDDLRYHMKDVLQALGRNEEVKVLHRGTLIGAIVPAKSKRKGMLVQDHPLFGCQTKSRKTVEEIIDELREPSYRDI
jgi:antitoxin (DNA-binding transcriptional repressor) of toxin-antitoxin stability system